MAQEFMTPTAGGNGTSREMLSKVIDIERNPYKRDFPLLANNPQITFLDSAATAQRPASVLDAERDFYEHLNSNPLRGLYKLSVEATEAVDKAREKVAKFINADSADDIVFTRNATESLNLMAKSLGSVVLKPDDEVVITIMEHHSNLIPWQQICKKTGAKLVYMYPDKQGFLSDEEIEKKIGPKAKIVSVGHVSNVLGIENPVKKIGERAHEQGAYFIVDGAQSAPHIQVDVKDIGCDAFAFSGHKIFSPMGIGVLWAKHDLLEMMPPMLTGGEMIDSVSEHDAVWAEIPHKFEAGTQDAAGAVALGAAIDYVNRIGMDRMEAREHALVKYLAQQLSSLDFVRLFGPEDPSKHVAVVSFNVCGIHPHDVASILDASDVCIRAGHHCAMPLMIWLGVNATCRASVAMYNDKQDIDRLISGLKKVWAVFNGD